MGRAARGSEKLRKNRNSPHIWLLSPGYPTRRRNPCVRRRQSTCVRRRQAMRSSRKRGKACALCSRTSGVLENRFVAGKTFTVCGNCRCQRCGKSHHTTQGLFISPYACHQLARAPLNDPRRVSLHSKKQLASVRVPPPWQWIPHEQLPTKYPLLAAAVRGQGLVGRSVQVFWDGEKRYYEALVLSFAADTCLHKVRCKHI
jgi:hypothetical protein